MTYLALPVYLLEVVLVGCLVTLVNIWHIMGSPKQLFLLFKGLRGRAKVQADVATFSSEGSTEEAKRSVFPLLSMYMGMCTCLCCLSLEDRACPTSQTFPSSGFGSIFEKMICQRLMVSF